MIPNFSKDKANYLQKCFFMINVMKSYNYEKWETYHAMYCATKPEESFELYQMLLEEYKHVQKPEVKKPAPKKPVAKKKPKIVAKKKAA